MSKTLIRNATIINEGETFRGYLLMQDDRILSMGSGAPEELPANTETINADGLLLIPGVIDDQVHFREPGLTHKGDLFSESRAAAAGGITSFMEMPNTIPQTVTIETLKEKNRLGSERSVINYSFLIGATNSNLGEVLKADPETVPAIKVFLGSSTGNMLVDNKNTLRELFRLAAIPICAHCEDEHIIRKNSDIFRTKYGEEIPFSYHPLIRSREACLASSSFAVKLAREFNTRLHLFHLSTADEMRLLNNQVPLREKRITGEVCVHHLWFDDSYYESLGTKIKWNPAIKTAFDRESLIRAVSNDLLDVIATDHAPHTIEEKSATYFKSPSGGPLVQHSLPAMLELYHRKIFSLEKIVWKMCHNPAILFNIKERGFLREGYKADLCLIDPDNPWTVYNENILYKCGWSPFEGITFRSKIVMTFVNGTRVYDYGILKDDYRGEKLMFDR